VDVGGGVKMVDVVTEFERNIEPFKKLVQEAIGQVAAERNCTDCDPHTGIELPFDQP
jgi:5'-methylthioadenosine phosphorylase